MTIFLLSFNSMNIKPVTADVSVDIDDTIRWKFYFYGEHTNDIIMTITNVSSAGGILTVEGNITYSDGTLIDEGVLILYNGVAMGIGAQYTMLGLGGVGLIPTPVNLTLFSTIFSNYTIVGNTITDTVGIMEWQMTYNDNGIMTEGKIVIGGIENYRLSLASQSSDGDSIPFGYSAIIIFFTGLILLAIKKRKLTKII